MAVLTALVLVAGLGALVARSGGGTGRPTPDRAAATRLATTTTGGGGTATSRAATTPPSETTTSAATPGAGPGLVSPTSSSPPPTSAPAPPTSPAPSTSPCRNSTEPRCGPFRWDPRPRPDQALVVNGVAVPPVARVGEPVTFQLVASDPDGQILRGSNRLERYGDGTGREWPVVLPGCVARYGPWDPPAPAADRFETTAAHAYATPGTYTATFGFNVDAEGCGDPYLSTGQVEVRVQVVG